MPAEFDRYAKEYSELLKDPLRDIFASEVHLRSLWMQDECFESREL
jgi:hypothetical protein